MPTRIPLTRGMFALVDDEDAERLSQWRWYAIRSSTAAENWYAVRHERTADGRVRTISMHREIMQPDGDLQVDHHPDRSGLNNQRANLRLATRAQNSQNRRHYKPTVTGFRGVSIYGHKFVAKIRANNKTHHLGVFLTAEEAAAAYADASAKYHGEFGRTS